MRKIKIEVVERECRWSMVAMGEDSTARRLVSASDDRRDRHAEQQEIIYLRSLRASMALRTATMSAPPKPSARVSP